MPGIFDATSTGIQTPRGSGLTRVNGVGFLLRQGEGVVRVQTFEGGYATVETKEITIETR